MGRGIQAPCKENILSFLRQHRSIHCNGLFVSFHCQWRFTLWSTVSQLASCHVVFSCRSHLMMCIIHHTSSIHHLYPSPSIKHDWNHWMLKVPCQEMFQELVQSQSAGSSVESNMDAYVVMGMLGCLFGGSSIHWMIWVFPKIGIPQNGWCKYWKHPSEHWTFGAFLMLLFDSLYVFPWYMYCFFQQPNNPYPMFTDAFEP